MGLVDCGDGLIFPNNTYLPTQFSLRFFYPSLPMGVFVLCSASDAWRLWPSRYGRTVD